MEHEDHGFNLPDVRHSFCNTSEELVAVKIRRHWFLEDEEANFKCSFDIVCNNDVTHLPIGCDEGKAIQIAHELYEEDIEATNSWNETEDMYAAERRMGA